MTVSAPPQRLVFKSIPLGELRIGFQLGSNIQDAEEKLLLAAGVEITAELLEKLNKRGIRQVSIDKRDWEKLTAFQSKGISRKSLPSRPRPIVFDQTLATNELDELAAAGITTAILPSPEPFLEAIPKHGAIPFNPQAMHEQFQQHLDTVDQVADLVDVLEQGNHVSPDQLESISHSTVLQAAKDMDLFVCLGINPAENKSIFDHSANVARLAIAIGINLGLDKKTLCELGAGCLVHDIGMLQIDENILQAKRILRPEEFIEIARHPILSTDLLYERMNQIPLGVRMVVYQMHERLNGMGYPRGWKADRIHFLSRIAAVADTYIALVSPRPYRRAMLPYSAVKQILEDVGRGLFDPQVVRSLLYSIGLFPLGSYVHLNDGRVGRVLRVNRAIYDCPIVECWENQNMTGDSEIVDLRNETVRVARPLTQLRR